MTDFMLPRPCVVGINLAAIVHSPSPANGGCSIRANEDEGCSTCHRQGARTPSSTHRQERVLRLVRVPNSPPTPTKPQNLKDFFNDWYGRRDPATGECPD